MILAFLYCYGGFHGGGGMRVEGPLCLNAVYVLRFNEMDNSAIESLTAQGS